MSGQPTHCDVALVIQIISIILGICAVIAGVTSFWFGISILIIMAVYLILFGILIIMAEVRAWGFLNRFGFLYSYGGRGAFLVFVGCVELQFWGNLFAVIVGFCTIVVGVVEMIIQCFCVRQGYASEPRPFVRSANDREPVVV